MVVLCFVSLFFFSVFVSAFFCCFVLFCFVLFFGGGGGGVSKTPSGVEIHCSFASCSFSCLNTPNQLAFTNCFVRLFS